MHPSPPGASSGFKNLERTQFDGANYDLASLLSYNGGNPMKAVKRLMLVVGGCAAVLTGAAIAETKVEVKKSHICCPACEKAVAKVFEKAGVKGAASKEDGTITFAAADDKAAQKVLDELAGAGFHGDTGNKDIKIKDDSWV